MASGSGRDLVMHDVQDVGVDTDSPGVLHIRRTKGDRIYRSVATAAGFMTFLILFLIGLFLLIKSVPAIQQQGSHFFTTQGWTPSDDASQSHFGVAALVWGTVVVALIALVIGRLRQVPAVHHVAHAFRSRGPGGQRHPQTAGPSAPAAFTDGRLVGTGSTNSSGDPRELAGTSGPDALRAICEERPHVQALRWGSTRRPRSAGSGPPANEGVAEATTRRRPVQREQEPR